MLTLPQAHNVFSLTFSLMAPNTGAQLLSAWAIPTLSLMARNVKGTQSCGGYTGLVPHPSPRQLYSGCIAAMPTWQPIHLGIEDNPRVA